MYTVRPLCAFTIKKRVVRGIDSVDPALPEMWRVSVLVGRGRLVGMTQDLEVVGLESFSLTAGGVGWPGEPLWGLVYGRGGWASGEWVRGVY